MARAKVKRDDIVTVISGGDKGKSGKVLVVDRAKGRVTVEGVNVRRKAIRRSPDHPQGGIADKECPVHISNVMSQDRWEARKKTQQKPEAGTN